ncbi:MAG: DNA-binding response regulator [Flavobacteriaceae bacterium]|nr:MAG: DNA-binding response regulator [Flavobacteriaceae bacterium]
MKCVVIDDEPLAVDVLVSFIERVPFLSLEATCSNGLDAMAVLQRRKVDLIFTDIEMPDFSGIEMIKSLEVKPLFIFTTAYAHYAVEGFSLNAVDYLMKPIPFHRFLKAVTRAQNLLCKHNLLEIPSQTVDVQPEFIFVKSEYENLKINLCDIRYVEGLKDYIKIYTKSNKPILTLSSLLKFEEKLGNRHFMRVHRSFIVSLRHIHSVQRNRIVIDDKRIPIGSNYKEEFVKIIKC